MRIIDFHVHPFMSADDYLSAYPEACSRPDLNMLVEDMNHAEISCFCGTVVSQKSNDYCKIISDNNKAYQIQDILGERYIPGIHVHPDYVDESIDEIKKAVANGVHLIGELVPYHHGWSDYSCEGFSEILSFASNYNMTVSLHTIDLAQMQTMALRHKDINFVFAHPGAPEQLSEHISVMKKCPNVYLDLSGTGLHRYGILKKLCSEVGAERILFGTDYPICNAKMYVNAVLGEHISDNEKELILGRNAARLLNLEES